MVSLRIATVDLVFSEVGMGGFVLCCRKASKKTMNSGVGGFWRHIPIVMTLMPELESKFSPLLDEYLNGENQVVLKSFAVTTADASDKRQQQPDSTSSTSTLATSVTADGNFDL
ncbi:hypothetical protein Tco_0162527 [Tanacetum coccineum]